MSVCVVVWSLHKRENFAFHHASFIPSRHNANVYYCLVLITGHV